ATPTRRFPPPTAMRLEVCSSSDLRSVEATDICKARAIPVFATLFQALLTVCLPPFPRGAESTTSGPARKLPRATRGAHGASLGRSPVPLAKGRGLRPSTFTHIDNSELSR